VKNMKISISKRSSVVFFVSLLLLLIWLYYGNTSIGITEYGIESGNLPADFDGFKIAQISDLHNAAFGKNQRWLLSAIKKSSPDIIAVTGDLIDSRHTNIQNAMNFINEAVKIAPVYYVTGNHEARTEKYVLLKEQMEGAGVFMLDNKNFSLNKGKSSILIVGLADPSFLNSGKSSSEAEIDTRLKEITASGKYTMLLSHRPEFFDIYAKNGVNLVLSGHAHGGQIRLPFIGGLFAPNQGFFPKYSKGIYEEDQTKVVVSRGLGNSLFPVRINNCPELVLITLRRK